jgi:hypothetical protein
LLIPLVAQVTHSNDDASLWPKLASTNTTGDTIWHGFEAPIYTKRRKEMTNKTKEIVRRTSKRVTFNLS